MLHFRLRSSCALALLALGLLPSAPSAQTPRLLKDINATSGLDGSSSPMRGHFDGKVLLFAATRPDVGQELWRTDGTSAGTWLLKDIDPGSSGSGPDGFVTLGGVSYFVAGTKTHGRELWRTDGTPLGTWMVKDIEPGPIGAASGAGPVLFQGQDLLRRADEGARC
jgi:ELWxxDGT repeat protein